MSSAARSAATPRKQAAIIPIDECLFGPDRVCPPSVCEAIVLSPEKQNNEQNGHDESLANTPSTSPRHSTQRRSPPRTPGRSRRSNGLDDLEDGRWEAAMHTPSPSMESTKENGTTKEEPSSSSAASSCSGHVISLPDLRRLASQGIVDGGSHRPVAWRVLLGYLPPATMEWKSTLLEHRTLYRSLVADLFQTPDDELYKGNELRGHHGKKQQRAKQQQRKEQEEARADSSNGVVDKKSTDEIDNTTTDDPTALLDRLALQRSQSVRVELAATLKPTLTTSQDDSHLVTWSEAREEQSDGVLSPPSSPTHHHQPARRKRSSSIGGCEPDEEMGRIERRLLLTGQPPDPPSLFIAASPSMPSPPLRRRKVVATLNASSSNDGYESLVPQRIREEWKRSGRDSAALAGMRGGPGHGVNMLLVTDHHYQQQHSPRKNEMEQQSSTETDTDATTSNTTTTSPPHHHEETDKWYQFFENASLLDEIRKDVIRTHPDLFFFLEPDFNLGARRYAALERILFVWAKLNKGVRYVQGMNEIVGTLYYVLANDLNEEWACEAEADTYFLFNILMTEMRDVFVPALDDADTGIQGRIANMKSLLSLHDPEVRCHLDDCGIDASFYAIRWLTTLLSREFLLPDTIRLWDSMFASTHKDNFLRYVCVTMVMMIREDLLKGDFSTCLRLLQSYPPTNLDQLLESSRALWIYESQVTLACHKGGISLHQALSTITPPPSIVMAYGLPGGVAISRAERAEQQQKEGNGSSQHNKAANLSATGRKVLQGARGFLGGLGREVGAMRKARSTGSALNNESNHHVES